MRLSPQAVPKQGSRFGLLTVITTAEHPSSRMAYLLCQCDCGKTTTARWQHIRSGQTRSCGCRGQNRKTHAPVHIGMKSNRWTVVGEPRRINRYLFAECQCECGTIRDVLVAALKTATNISCGCYRIGRPIRRKYHPLIGESGSRMPEYKVLVHIRERCLSPSTPAYASYGSKGITICERWLGLNGFVNFLSDMGRRPSSDHDIDRIDSTKGYSPDNCRWLPHLENMRRPRPRRHKTHCKMGHAMTPENTTIRSKGDRRCRTCHNESQRQRAARLKALSVCIQKD